MTRAELSKFDHNLQRQAVHSPDCYLCNEFVVYLGSCGTPRTQRAHLLATQTKLMFGVLYVRDT